MNTHENMRSATALFLAKWKRAPLSGCRQYGKVMARIVPHRLAGTRTCQCRPRLGPAAHARPQRRRGDSAVTPWRILEFAALQVKSERCPGAFALVPEPYDGSATRTPHVEVAAQILRPLATHTHLYFGLTPCTPPLRAPIPSTTPKATHPLHLIDASSPRATAHVNSQLTGLALARTLQHTLPAAFAHFSLSLKHTYTARGCSHLAHGCGVSASPLSCAPANACAC